MDILACVLAYLGCAAGIVVALAMSFAVVFSTPDQPITAPHGTLASQPNHVKTVAAEQVMHDQVKLLPEAVDADQATDRFGAKHARDIREARRATELARLRRLAHDEQARRWAYQQTPDFEHRFPSFTD